MTTNKAEYHRGDLVEIIREGSYTLCYSFDKQFPNVQECPAKEFEVYSHPRDYKNIFENLEGKFGLIVYVSRNRLEQCLGYRVLIEGQEMFLKSIVAHKYFRLVENQTDETGGPSKI